MFEFSRLWFQKYHGTKVGAAVQERKTGRTESFRLPIQVENREKPQSEAMVDSHKVDERENALEESKGANCTNEEAYACFDNTGTNRKQASLEFTSLVDSKELSASSPGVLQPRRPRKPKEDKQVESTAVILKGEQKAEDITIGGTSSKEKLSEEDLNYKEACQNERGEGSTPREEEWTSSGQRSGEQSGGGNKDVKALEKKEKDQAFTSGGVIKEEKRLSKGQPTSAPQDLQRKSSKGDLEEENIYSGHTTEECEKNLSFVDVTKTEKGVKEDANVGESPKGVQDSKATLQKGASKPQQRGIQTTSGHDLLLKKSASSTAKQQKIKQCPCNLVNHAHKAWEHHASGGGGQENDSREIVFCKPRPFGETEKQYFYEKGSVFRDEENKVREFKSLANSHINGLPWIITDKAIKFTCAVLNGGQKGTLYLGVADDVKKESGYKHGEIVGLHIADMKDDINKALQAGLDDHMLSDAGPLQKGGEQNCIAVHYVPVKIHGNRSKLFVVEIEVARDWRFCKKRVYYSKTWRSKHVTDCTGQKALDTYFKVKANEFDDVEIRTIASSSHVKPFDVYRQVKEPLEVKYKEWKKKEEQG